MSLRNQRELASRMLKVGKGRVHISPEHVEDVEGVITRAEIRKLVHEGTITIAPPRGTSRGRTRVASAKRKSGLKRGTGSRTGKSTARTPRKSLWINRIRSIRRHIRILRDHRTIQKSVYRRLYLLAKGGVFKDRNAIDQYIEANKLSRRR
ncbi:50S ribosomal protein L19e [Candidatus Bathyarchaeota archaeon]|nr:50S ribosomal protein L19e [Candidatus Bathyarchaeota archaeon]